MVDSYAWGVPIAEVVRSGIVESRHVGSVVVVDADGAVVAAHGDVDGPVLPRSSCKPLQAVGLLRAGFRPAGTAQLALAAASHRGEPVQLDLVRAMLIESGVDEHDVAVPIGHNCSGKHVAMLATCRANGWPAAGYLDPAHPVQRALHATAEELAGPVAATAVDGCGAPAWALPLAAVARAFLGLVAAPAGTDRRAVADAMRAYPELVRGTGPEDHDTVLMRAWPGLLAKVGAEGVQAVAVPGLGAVAVKVDDGAIRPLLPVVLAALARVGVDLPLPTQPVLGGGVPVGEIRPLV